MPTRNRPIAKLIKWFVNREKGKVVDARNEIQRRFPYLDWSIQKKILLSFLSSSKTDRKWAYGQLIDFWDDSLYPKVKEIWETYHEQDMIYPAIRCFPKSYLREHSDEFANGDYYYRFCRRFMDEPDFQIDRKRLSPKQYLMLLRHGNRSITDEDAFGLVLEQIHKICCEYTPAYAYGVLCRGTDLDGKDIPDVMDFKDIYAMVSSLEEMGKTEAVKMFYQWVSNARSNFTTSDEYPSLIAENYVSFGNDYKKMFLVRRMLYMALPDKYKKRDGEEVKDGLSSFKSYLQHVPYYHILGNSYLTDNGANEIRKEPEVVNPPTLATLEQIKEMAAENPVIATLIEKFGLETEQPTGDLCPF